jgi:DNA-binding transcriptional LysR family regulator
MISIMETLRLRQFKVIVDAGGLLKASELLGISGGGLSKSMKALEAELGYTLFVQKGRGLVLTSEGRQLYAHVPAFLKTVEDLLTLKAPKPADGEPLRLISFEVFTTYFSGFLISQFFKDRVVEVREAIPGQMETAIAEGHSDLGITYLPIPHADVEFLKVGRIKMAAFGLKGLGKGVDLSEIPFVIPVAPIQGTPSGVQGLDGWPEHLFARKIVYRVQMMETALELCRRGLAAAFLPEFVVKLVNQQVVDKLKLVELPLPRGVPSITREVFLIHRKNTKESREIRDVAKALRALE